MYTHASVEYVNIFDNFTNNLDCLRTFCSPKLPCYWLRNFQIFTRYNIDNHPKHIGDYRKCLLIKRTPYIN